MEHELVKYIVIVVMGGLLSVFLCIYALVKIKNAPGAKYYILGTFMSSIFTLSYAFELSSNTLEQIKYWIRIEYIGLSFLPAFILLMCFEYVGKKVKHELYYLLFGIPVITIVLQFSNELHHFYYISMGLRSDSPFPVAKLEGGPWFYVFSVFLYSCVLISIVILLMQIKRITFRFRMQILAMVAGLIVPVIGSVFYQNDLSQYGIDFGPVSMSISFIFHGVALVSFQMFNVAPIARDTVFESMEDGVIVVNKNNIFVDFNNAMLQLLPMLYKHMIGKSLGELGLENQKLAEIIFQEQECDYEAYRDGQTIHYHIRFSPVLNKSNLHIGKIITFANVTERVLLEKELKQLASMDGLTHVFNRTFFMKQSEKAIESLNADGGGLSVVMFDIDHFKQVNDTYGHEAGDIVLTQVARLVKENLRTTDIIGRYGGEEFIITMPNTPLWEASDRVEAIRAKISDFLTFHNDHEIRVTSSFGITHALVEAGGSSITIQRLMQQADHALYAAKSKGRNRVLSYQESSKPFMD